MVTTPGRGQPSDFVEAIFTCKGDFYDPNFPSELDTINKGLQRLLNAGTEQLVVKKVEPWNSVKVTLNIPKEVAERLKSIAHQNDGAVLRNMGIMSLQMEGDRNIGLSLTRSSSHNQLSIAASTSGASSSSQAGSTSSTHSLHRNLLNLSGKSSTSDGGGMQPPTPKVPPLVISKPKHERRQRKTGSSKSTGSRVRSSKSKTSVTASSSMPITSLSQPTSVVSSLPTQLITSTSTTTITSSTPVADVINQVVPHPALKDTKLSTLPSSSLAADGSDDRLIASELLASLFEKSLANSKTTALLPPHNTLSDMPIDITSKHSHMAGGVAESTYKSSSKQSVQRQQQSPTEQRMSPTPSSIPQSNSSSSPQPINLSKTPSADTGATPCSDIEDRLSPTGDNDTSSLGRSPNAPEHVSVIAGPMLTRKVASPQTEAMDLSHHKSPTENADHNSHPAVDMDDMTVCDNPLPMDLSSNTKPSIPATPPTPLTPPTSEPERIDQVPSLQVHPDKPELPVSDIPSLVEAPVLVSSSESGAPLDDWTAVSSDTAPPSLPNCHPKASTVIDSDIPDNSVQNNEAHCEQQQKITLESSQLIASSATTTDKLRIEPEVANTMPSLENSAVLISQQQPIAVTKADEDSKLTIDSQSQSATLHGRAVSVICSTVETPKTEPGDHTNDVTNTSNQSMPAEQDEVFNSRELPPVAEQQQPDNNDEVAAKPNSVSVIVSDFHIKEQVSHSDQPLSNDVKVGNEEKVSPNHELSPERKDVEGNKDPEPTVKADSEVVDLPKYSGPTPPHQLLTTVDHEPAENGSSTSTDSGVVTGSPKSDDICPTPPSVEESNSTKPDADPFTFICKSDPSEMPAVVTPVLSDTNDEASADKVIEPIPVIASLAGKESPLSDTGPSEMLAETTASAGTTDGETPHPVSNITTSNSIVSSTTETPTVANVTVIMPSSIATANTAITGDNLPAQPNKNRPCVSILKTAANRPVQTKVISTEKYANVTPITTKVITPENKVSIASHKLPQPVMPQQQSSGRAVDTISYLFNSQSNMSSVLMAAANAASSNRPYYVVPSNPQSQQTLVKTPISGGHPPGGSIIISKANRSVPTKLVFAGQGEKQLVLLENRNERQLPPTIIQQPQQYVETISKPAFIIAKDPTSNGGKVQLKTADVNSPLLLKGVKLPSKEIKPHHHPTIISTHPVTATVSIVSSSSQAKPSTMVCHPLTVTPKIVHRASPVVSRATLPATNTHLHKVVTVAKGVHGEPAELNLPAVTIINHPSSNTGSALNKESVAPNVSNVSSVRTPALNVTSHENSMSTSNANNTGTTNSKLETSAAHLDTEVCKDATIAVDTKPSQKAETAHEASNGISDSDTHETESVNSGVNPASMSPVSVNSAVLEVQTSNDNHSSSQPPLASPTNQRKSGRVRTLKSPDPEYVTPAKGRKRGARQMSEESSASDTVSNASTAPVTKKMSKPTKAEAADTVSVQTAQTNGPTSLKRSTRSSGVSDHQALPSGYRERKRPKR